MQRDTIAEDGTPMPLRVALRSATGELDRQARVETEAGIGVPIEDVEAWVESWDTPNELPMPKARQAG